MLEVVLIGAMVGTLSGFFGIGGGTILIPLLLMLGYDTKVAIGISVVQMFFSSVYGSYLNHKKGTLEPVMVLFIGIGGFLGASLSGYVTSSFSNKTLEILFLAFALFALFRLFVRVKEHKQRRNPNRFVLVAIGAAIGVLSMTIGVGGSILLVPVLVGFLYVPLKEATSAGLFFVVFSSFAGLISHSINGSIDYSSGVLIGLSSLFGVYFGIHLKHIIDVKVQKKLLMLFYLIIVIYLSQRVFSF